MLKKIYCLCLASFCLFEIQIIFGTCDKSLNDLDVFQTIGLNTFDLERRAVIRREDRGKYTVTIYENESEIERLNNLLVERTDSVDLETNFEVILEELLLEYKNNVGSNSKSVQAKRLFLALQTLKGEHLCDRYGYEIIRTCSSAFGPPPHKIKKEHGLRRIDKILTYYIKERVDKCFPIYLEKYDQITAKLDPIRMKALDYLIGDYVERIKTDASLKIPGESEAEKFYNVANHKYFVPVSNDPARMYGLMKRLAEGDIDAIYLLPIENERSGAPGVVKEKFEQLYNRYLAQPCQYFREQFEMDVFRPVVYDDYYGHVIQKDRPDFYEAWYKYELCSFLFERKLDKVAKYADSLGNDRPAHLKNFPGFLQ